MLLDIKVRYNDLIFVRQISNQIEIPFNKLWKGSLVIQYSIRGNDLDLFYDARTFVGADQIFGASVRD